MNLRNSHGANSTHNAGDMATMVLRPAPSEPQLPRTFSLAGNNIVRRHSPPRELDDADSMKDEDNFVLRHGFEEDHTSEEYLTALADVRSRYPCGKLSHSLTGGQRFWMYYTDKRHETGGRPQPESQKHVVSDWRQRDRCKTIVAALMLCLNIGVDPPDIVKTQPTAKLECWIDPGPPQGSGNTKLMETIGKALQTQYETLSIRTRYKQWLDPSIEDTKKCCVSLRRNAREERVLFHYNGHGVPLPTPSGEVWYFNRNYTQYIPVSLYDLQLWLASPTIYVFDVSHAGNIVENFERFIIKHTGEDIEARRNDPNATNQNYSDNIILAACGEKESLPTNPDLPADLFTCCLTSPVMIALRCFVMNSELPTELSLKDVERIPGRLQERRTPLGELNWIFTAITDTIAWNALPTPLFKKLFRQDLMVAALFRNYLLAERLMRAHGCHPETIPALPPTHTHPLWQAWDLAIEMVVAQLPALLQAEDSDTPYEFHHSSFFAEQLTAFDVYLSQGAPQRKAPSQLPIVLQVLLSQAHRLRALVLLSRFLDLGPWAVDLALNIGIFPYVLKLLQSLAPELKPVMIFIWTRLLAVDQSCQADLLRDSGYKYFLAALQPTIDFPVKNASEHRAMSTFIISMFCRSFQQGRAVSMTPELFQACKDNMQDQENPLLRQWSCLCISILWQDYPEAKWMGINLEAHTYLTEMCYDPVPEVRAAALHALSNFIGIPDLSPQVTSIEESIALNIMGMTLDGNSMVRVELLVFFSVYVKRYVQKFLVAAFEELVDLRNKLKNPHDSTEQSKAPTSSSVTSASTDAGGSSSSSPDQGRERRPISENSIQGTMWKHLWIMSVDPHPEVAEKAAIVVDHVHIKLLESPLRAYAKDVMDELQRLGKQQKRTAPKPKPQNPVLNRVQTPPVTESPSIPRSESYITMGLRRTFSTVRSMTLGAPATPSPQVSPPKDPAAANGRGLRQPIPQRRLPTEWTRPPDAQDPQSSAATYQHAKTPTPRGFHSVSTTQPISIPLQSGFLDWCIEVFEFVTGPTDIYIPLTHMQYFREPQMKPNEYEEPGSDEYNSRLWRRSRNERTLDKTQPLKVHAGVSRWDIPDGSFNNGLQPTKMCFHQFEDHLVIADDRDTIW